MQLIPFGRVLMSLGALLFLIGLLFSLSGRLPWLGRLPGDFYFEHDDVHFYLPLTTSLLISLVVTMLIHLVSRR